MKIEKHKLTVMILKLLLNLSISLILAIVVGLMADSLSYAFLAYIFFVSVGSVVYSADLSNGIDNKKEVRPLKDREITRVYNQYGEAVEERQTIYLESGYWVTKVSRKGGDFLIEHTRTEENQNAFEDFGSIKKYEAEYNRKFVFGAEYGRKRFIQRFNDR